MEFTKKVKGTIASASAFVMASLCIIQPAFSQEAAPPQTGKQQAQDFSEADLVKFLQANEKAVIIQKESQAAMMAAIEKENLSIEKFNELVQAHQQQKLAEVEASPEEMASFNRAAQTIIELQPKAEENIQKAIEEEGLSMDKFKDILLAYEQNPAVKSKVSKILQEQKN